MRDNLWLIIIFLILLLATPVLTLEYTQRRLDKFEYRIDKILTEFKGKTTPAINIYKTDRTTIYGADGELVIEVSSGKGGDKK